jgi:hypothetical protein
LYPLDERARLFEHVVLWVLDVNVEQLNTMFLEEIRHNREA